MECCDSIRKNVCILSQNENESIIYNTANYRLFIIVDYMNSLYQSRLNNDKINADNKILLDEIFGDLNSGYSVYFTKFEIEIAYAPALENYKNLTMFSQNLSDQIIERIKELQKTEVKTEEEGDDD
ncbi:21443_t:CDS:2 [Cetraspora pellucida]|uniref:21443_t:CDS:1 n=1 Tax=Cetraspora pellucida TaxID=1433469 RepID=A0A9N9BXC1_9GLOM|nr:21443_t:CDS:2 [Cetraspora pellucida]